MAAIQEEYEVKRKYQFGDFTVEVFKSNSHFTMDVWKGGEKWLLTVKKIPVAEASKIIDAVHKFLSSSLG